MATFLRLVTAGGILSFIAAKLNWTDEYHVAVLAGSCVLALVIRGVALFRRRNFPRAQFGRNTAEHMLRSILVGAVCGVGTLLVAGGLFSTLAAFHVSDAYYERGREGFEVILVALEEAKSYEAAALKIEGQLPTAISARWRLALAQRMVADLVAASRAAEKTNDQRRLLEKASKIANHFHVDASMAELLLAKLGDDAIRIQLGEAAKRLEGQLDEESTKLKASETKQAQLQSELTQQVRRLYQTEYEKLLAVAEAQTDPPRKQASLTAASAFARQHGLDCSTAEIRLHKVTADIDSQLPQNLPASAALRLLRVHALPPVQVVELEICEPTGRHIGGLSAKDFIITDQAGRRLAVDVAEDALRTATSLDLCIAVDHSASTAGRPLEEAKRGVRNLLGKLDKRVATSLLGFNSNITNLSDIDSITAEGGTAMYAAIDAAIQCLVARAKDHKVLLLVTDGHNTAGGPSLDEVLRHCLSEKIVVHVVALRTAETDESTLARIARETGGSLAIESIDSIASTLGKMATVPEQPVYRLITKSVPASSAQIHIQVGAAPSLTTTCDLVAVHR